MILYSIILLLLQVSPFQERKTAILVHTRKLETNLNFVLSLQSPHTMHLHMLFILPPRYIWNFTLLTTLTIYHSNFNVHSNFFNILLLPLLPLVSVRIDSNSLF